MALLALSGIALSAAGASSARAAGASGAPLVVAPVLCEKTPVSDRRGALLGGLAAALALGGGPAPAHAILGLGGKKRAVEQAFQEAYDAAQSGNVTEAMAAWGRAIEADETIPAAWSNRGVLYLQTGDYASAAEDLSHAAELERKAYGYASGLSLCGLGTARGAAGDWEGALDAYEEAELDDFTGISALAKAYGAIVKVQLGYNALAKAQARAVIDDPEAPMEVKDDMSALLAGIAFAEGDEEGAAKEAKALGGASGLRARVGAVDGGWSPKAADAVLAYAKALDAAGAP